MPCPFTTELARTLSCLKEAHRRAVKAAKNQIGVAQADRALFRCQRMYEAALRVVKEAEKRNAMRSAAE